MSAAALHQRPSGDSLGQTLAAAAARLAAAGIASPRLDARVLAAHVLGVEPGVVFNRADARLDAGQAEAFENLIAARLDHRPVAHLIGAREFWSLPFKVTADTLVPRPDSETLIDAVLERVGARHQPLRILDLGAGSGCLVLALLSELACATGLGIDASAESVDIAADNARRLGLAGRVEFRLGDWAGGVGEVFDIVVCNPPYVRSADIDRLEPEVARFEPRSALDGGADGLDAYRALAPALPRLLAADGIAVLEIGFGQAAAVARIIRGGGLQVVEIKDDLAGIPRCVVAR